MVITLVNRLAEAGDLQRLYRAGLIGSKVLRYRDLYLSYDKELKLGRQSAEAITFTADEFRVSELTVYKAIDLMTSKTPEVPTRAF